MKKRLTPVLLLAVALGLAVSLAGASAAIPTGTELPVPAGAAGSPLGIAAGPDGNLWFTEETANQIGRIGPTGGVTEVRLTSDADVSFVAAGADGNLWFTEFRANQIGRMTPAGAVREFPVPSGLPDGIAAGPDGNLWFTENGPGIGRITLTGAVTEF